MAVMVVSVHLALFEILKTEIGGSTSEVAGLPPPRVRFLTARLDFG